MGWKSRAATLSVVFALGTCGSESAPSPFGDPLVAGLGFGGPNGSLLHTVDSAHTEWRCIDGAPVLFVVGTVSVRNGGNSPAEGLRVVDRVELGLSGEWTPTAGGVDLTLPTLQPGETLVHPYAFALEWDSALTYRHGVRVTPSGIADTPDAPEPPTSTLLAVQPPVDLCAETCTLTSTYWRVQGPGAADPYVNVWPVKSLTLGTLSYDAEEVQDILGRSPGREDGSTSLAQELIAAKLNIAAGADPRAIASTLRAADALIGDGNLRARRRAPRPPIDGFGLTRALAEYNRGLSGPGGCG